MIPKFRIHGDGAGRGRKRGHVEPRMIFKERCKTLTDHACAANDTDIILFHFFHPSCLQDILSKMMKCTLKNKIKVKFHF